MSVIALNPTGAPAGVPPYEWREAVTTRLEQHLGIVAALLALLDDIDGDPDLEPDGTEDDISALDGWRRVHDDFIASEDSEQCDTEEDDGTAEPSLGAPEIPPTRLMHDPDARYGWSVRQGTQETWAEGARTDGEEDGGDMPEAVNEDGGDVLDVSHDAEGQDFITGGGSEGDQFIGFARLKG